MSAAGTLRAFLESIDPAWTRMVIEPSEAESDEMWTFPDMVPDVCNNLMVVAALTLLAYYENCVRTSARQARSEMLDSQLHRLLHDSFDPLPMTGAQALTTIEWALECDAIPMIAPGSLKLKHVMFLNTIARERSDAYHRDYQYHSAETARAPLPELVRHLTDSLSFLRASAPDVDPSAYGVWKEPSGRSSRFALGPFFALSEDAVLLPFWRYDPTDHCYVYRSLWSGRELRRPRPDGSNSGKSQRLVTALLSSSFRPLAELARVTSAVLRKRENRPILQQILTDEDQGRRGDGANARIRSFQNEPMLGTWRLITEYGPIGLLERDGKLADAVFRLVNQGDDDRALEELSEQAESEGISAPRLIAIKTAQILGLDVQPVTASGEIDRLYARCGRDQQELDRAKEFDAFGKVLTGQWNDELERELRFLIIFYVSLPARSGDVSIKMTRSDVDEIFKGAPRALDALWTLMKKRVIENDEVQNRLQQVVGRDCVMSDSDTKSMDDLIPKIAKLRARWQHWKPELPRTREALAEFLGRTKELLDLLRGSRNLVKPIHPHLLTFKTATFTNGGLTTLQYSSELSGTRADLVVYTSRQIDLARAYHCLPKVGNSEILNEPSSTAKSVLVDPLLVDALAISRLLEPPKKVTRT